MAILINETLPGGVSIEMIDAATVEANAADDPPTGLIVHVTYVEDGRVHIVDVWESFDAYERFGRERLGPAMARLPGQQGMRPGEPERTVVDLHQVIRGRG
jgi:hypothetical protein